MCGRILCVLVGGVVFPVWCSSSLCVVCFLCPLLCLCVVASTAAALRCCVPLFPSLGGGVDWSRFTMVGQHKNDAHTTSKTN